MSNFTDIFSKKEAQQFPAEFKTTAPTTGGFSDIFKNIVRPEQIMSVVPPESPYYRKPVEQPEEGIVRQTLREIAKPILHPIEAAKEFFPTLFLKESIKDYEQKADAFSKALLRASLKGGSKLEVVSTGADVLASFANAAISPISNVFGAAAKIPIVGSAAALMGIPFIAAGELGKVATNQLVSHLPIDDKSKEILRQPIENLGTTAAQLTLGAYTFSKVVGYMKKGIQITPKEATQIVTEIPVELKEIPKEVSKVREAPKPVVTPEIQAKIAPEYIYHGTPVMNLENIGKEGLLPKMAKGMKISSFTIDPEMAKGFGGMYNYETGIVRMKKSEIPKSTKIGGWDNDLYLIDKKISPEKLEYSRDGGKTWQSFVSKIAPETIEWTGRWISPKTGEILTRPSPKIINELSNYKPEQPVTLYRGINPENISSERFGLESWTYDKSVAQGWAGKDGKVVSKVVNPNDILIDFTKAPKSLTGEEFGQSAKEIKEVIVKSKIAPELQPFAQEAMKYKSAEEFVNSQKPVFRGGEALDTSQIGDRGLPVTTDRKVAETFLKAKEDFRKSLPFLEKPPISLEKSFISPLAKIATKKDIPESIFNAYKAANPAMKPEIAEPIIGKWAKENRFDAVDFSTLGKISAKEAEIKIYNPDILKTKSQLTDFYNQAVGVKEAPTIPETKVRGLALGVEAKAIENKLTKGFGELPEYQTVNMKEQAKLASDLIKNNYEQARRIAMGEEAPPQGIISESIFVGIENLAIKQGDVATLRDLATKSSLTTEATTMGQRIRTLAERDPESPVAQIKEVMRVREKAAEKKVKDLPATKKRIVDEIKSEIKKISATKQTWAEFIKSIKCA